MYWAHDSLDHAPHINPEALADMGYTEKEINEADARY